MREERLAASGQVPATASRQKTRRARSACRNPGNVEGGFYFRLRQTGLHYLLRPAAAALRLRQRLARQLLVAVGRVIHEGRDDDGVLLHVGGLDALVDVHVRVVRPAVVLDRILDELEAREPYRVERLMIRAPRIPD